MLAGSTKEADMGAPAIAVLRLRKSFGPKEAVAGIDLEIAAGSLSLGLHKSC